MTPSALLAVKTKRKRTERRAILGRFLGWLARQPIEAEAKSPTQTADSTQEPLRLTVAEAEALPCACPDLDTQRLVALSIFAGPRPREVESLHGRMCRRRSSSTAPNRWDPLYATHGLYPETHGSIEKHCADRWKICRSHAYRLMAGSAVFSGMEAGLARLRRGLPR